MCGSVGVSVAPEQITCRSFLHETQMQKHQVEISQDRECARERWDIIELKEKCHARE